MVMSVDKIKSSSYKNVSFTDISARVKSIFSAINYGANGYVAYRKDARGLHIIDFQFYANSAIGSGSGTLSGVQKELMEGYDDDILTNYYDIKTSSSIKHIADISSQSIIEQLELGENDYTDMIKDQKEYIQRITAENDKLAEELRLIKAKLAKGRLLRELKQEYLAKGIDPEEINMILEDEYTVPFQEGDLPNGDE